MSACECDHVGAMSFVAKDLRVINAIYLPEWLLSAAVWVGSRTYFNLFIFIFTFRVLWRPHTTLNYLSVQYYKMIHDH